VWEHLNVKARYFVRRATFPGWEIRPRRIWDHELVYVLKGYGEIEIEGEQYRIGPGDLVWFRPDQLHSLTVDEEPCMVFFAVHFSLPEQAERLPLESVQHIGGRRLEPCFRALEEIWHQRNAWSAWQQNLCLERIICESVLASQAQQESYDAGRVKKVLAFIHSDPYRQISLQDMLDQAGVKKSSFIHAFRSITGTTPLQYIQQLRLEYACDLLVQTVLPVAQIAERCGFADSFYFSRVFRKRFGMSPSQWRISRE